jgi:hemoglobin
MQNQSKPGRGKIFLLALALLLTVSGSAHRLGQGKAEKTLYQRLGGYDKIAAVADDFIGRLAADPRFAKFFAGFSVDSKKRLRQHLVDQLCAAAAGPCVYTGRDMKTTHAGLGISEDDWNAAAIHLVESLDKNKVPKKEKEDVLAFVTTLKKDIVTK